MKLIFLELDVLFPSYARWEAGRGHFPAPPPPGPHPELVRRDGGGCCPGTCLGALIQLT